jgi:NAD(P)-dependent dehydrogenase (short-subunit alcohol dehydrogenase family)
MSARLAGRVAVVTGASRGIGLAIAQRFAQEQAQVFAVARGLPALQAEVARLPGRACAIEADMSDPAAVDRAYAHVRTGAGRIDVLVANVGGAERVPLGAISEEHFDRVFRLNVKSALFTVQQALPLLAPGASVILVSSSAAHTATPAFSVYSAAKATLHSFARCWMLDLRERCVRVNVLTPGPTETPGLVELAAAGQARRMLAGFAARNPSGRVGLAQDVANAALFLASEDSAFVNGAELAVDGGLSQI